VVAASVCSVLQPSLHLSDLPLFLQQIRLPRWLCLRSAWLLSQCSPANSCLVHKYRPLTTSRLFKNPTLSDVTVKQISTYGTVREYYTHKMVLCMESRFFHRAFRGNFKVRDILHEKHRRGM
jgi:hypothetical protein